MAIGLSDTKMGEPRFSLAADKNKEFILAELRKILKPGDRVLEVASGTGQHALHFSSGLPDVIWQPSDRDLYEYGLVDALAEYNRTNLQNPVKLDVNNWPDQGERFNAVYSANCVHVINWSSVENYIRGATRCLRNEGAFILYGPFKYKGGFTTDSNRQFDEFLRNTYPGGGIRDFEAVDECVQAEGLSFQSDTAMPANNQLLVWRKLSA